MLKAWNRRVRMTAAMIKTLAIARTFSANPPALGFFSVDMLVGAGRAQGFCAFGTKRIGGFRSAHETSGACVGSSMKSAAILAPHGLKCPTL